MAAERMHADEIDIDPDQVRRLLAAQFPQWAGLPVAPVASSGTDNALFRVGPDLAARLPRVARSTGQVEKDLQWLPRLAPQLPLAVPEPLGLGAPGEGYPWTWGVYRWLDGEEVRLDRLADPCAAAVQLAEFVRALQHVGTAGDPLPEHQRSSRGLPVARRDGDVREAIRALRELGEIDAGAATAAWEQSLAAADWPGPPVWLHGDLLPGNLLAAAGRLFAVIDFSCLTVGDPACDAMAAWSVFTGPSRDAFRNASAADEDTWLRGRGWALSLGLIALPYYRRTNPGFAALARRIIAEVLADFAVI
ncbi:MAG TPA: aminoglycoside phosphotransferase family protein [Actinocrinis sp.]